MGRRMAAGFAMTVGVVAAALAAPTAAAAGSISLVDGALEIDDSASSSSLGIEIVRSNQLPDQVDHFFVSATKDLEVRGDCAPAAPTREHYRVTLRCERPIRLSVAVELGSGNDGIAIYPNLSYSTGRFDGGPGHDGFVVGHNGRDVFAGGPGFDAVEFLYYEVGVTATPDGVANDGAAGEEDNIGTDVESINGSFGDDLIVGTDGFNQMNGGSGSDRVLGLGGDDIVAGGEGKDLIDGGPGHDQVRGAESNRYESPDRLECGPGFDFAELDRLDTHQDCENGFFPNVDGLNWTSPWPAGVHPTWFPIMPTSAIVRGANARRSGRVVLLRMACRSPTGGRCRGSVRLDVAARKRGVRRSRTRGIGRARFSISAGSTRSVRVRLNPHGRRLLKGRRRLGATAVLRLADTAATKRSRITIRVRR